MATTQSVFKINGFVDPRNSVWDNIEKISSASSAWTTYDTTTGKWSLVINREETPVKTFDDTNIVGNISLSKSPLSTAYTGGKFKFSNRDQAGAFDTLEFDFSEINDFTFENYDYRSTDIENKIEITNELVNNSVQADVLLGRELKQSRRRTNIEFFTDFGGLDILAGDVINVKSDLFYVSTGEPQGTKKFRVIEIEEVDGDGGEILLKIIGVEYSDEDYELFGFEKFTTLRADPMPPIGGNTTVQSNIAEGDGVKVGNALATDAGRAAITGAGVPVIATISGGLTAAEAANYLGAGSGSTNSNFLIVPVGSFIKNMQITIQGPIAQYDYIVDSVTKSIIATVPTAITLQYSANNTSYSTLRTQYLEWSTYTSVFNVANANPGYYRLVFSPLITFDLNATSNVVTIPAGITASDIDVDQNGFAIPVSVVAFLS
ncbi:hypothetical protein N9991_00215 [bacterium]|jgi:hypothetical protein|nr:hypothetical protein [bacterium]